MADGALSGVRRDGRRTYAFLTATIYISMGALDLMAGIAGAAGGPARAFMGSDPIGGAVLVLVGLVMLQGHRELAGGRREGVAFVYVGIGLGLLFGGIALAKLGADALGHALIGGPVYARWSPVDDVVPALYLAVLPLAGALAWRRSLTLRERGRPRPVATPVPGPGAGEEVVRP